MVSKAVLFGANADAARADSLTILDKVSVVWIALFQLKEVVILFITSVGLLREKGQYMQVVL